MLHPEIHYRYEPDRLQFEIPPETRRIPMQPDMPLPCKRCLIDDRIARIKERPVPEIRLLRKLHLNQILLTRLSPDRNVKDRSPVFRGRTQMLRILESHFSDFPFPDDAIQKCNQYILTLFASENPLEHIVVRKICITAPRPWLLCHHIPVFYVVYIFISCIFDRAT